LERNKIGNNTMDYFWWEILKVLVSGGLFGWAYARLYDQAGRLQQVVDRIALIQEADDEEEDEVEAEDRVDVRGQQVEENWDLHGPPARPEFEGDDFVVENVQAQEAFMAEAVRGILWYEGYLRGLADAQRQVPAQVYAGGQLVGVIPPAAQYRDLPAPPVAGQAPDGQAYVPPPMANHVGVFARRVDRGDYEQV
jgi:hypothetical protein